MSALGFTVTFLIYGHFLPLVFFYHIISVAVISLWNGQSISMVLQDIVSMEDDIYLPYPPGYFNFLKPHPQDFQDEYPLSDDSCSSNASIADDLDDSILSFTQEIASIIPVIIVSDDELPCLPLDDDTSLLQKDGHDFSNTSASHILNVAARSAALLSISDLRHEEDLHTDTDYSPSSSASEQQYVLTVVADLVRSTELVINSSTIDSWHEEIRSPDMDRDSVSLPSLASGLIEEPDELDWTEEEEAIIETLCIQMPDVVPTIEQLAENPHVPANVPVFSRHNISSKVVFPARKSFSPPPAQSRSSALSENVNIMFSQVSASWNRTKAELQQRRDGSGPLLSSMISSKLMRGRGIP